MAQRLPRHLPMRLVPIGKPHVHHERISVVGAFNPIGARLWFQSHRDKSHFPNCPMGGEKNLRLEGTSALRSDRRRRIAPGAQSKRFGFVPRGTQSFPPAGVPGVTAPPGLSTAQPFVRIAPRHSLQDLIFECRAFGVILLEPAVRSNLIGKDLEMVGISNLLAGVDIDPNRCHWSLLSFRRPQCRSFDESYSGIGLAPCKASIIPTWACINGPRSSAAIKSASVAACHSGACSWAGS